MAAAIAVVISLVSLLFSVIAFARTQRASVRPVLVFALDSDQVWKLKNVGRGPAMNVLVGEQTQDGVWTQVIRCNPIAVGDATSLPWLEYAWELAATYRDVDGREYTSRCRDHLTDTKTRNEFPDWKPVDREFERRQEVSSPRVR